MDTDGDGLDDNDEITLYGTEPANRDSDGDFLPDGWEVQNSLDPLVNFTDSCYQSLNNH